jgi:hypothetical protein
MENLVWSRTIAAPALHRTCTALHLHLSPTVISDTFVNSAFSRLVICNSTSLDLRNSSLR